MATRLLHPRKTEFYNRSPENFILVENYEDGSVVIRAALDNYSERRKSLFIRELAAEGFIPDEYQFMTNAGENGFVGAQWVIDSSWLVVPPQVISTAHRCVMIIVLSVFLVVAVMVCVAII